MRFNFRPNLSFVGRRHSRPGLAAIQSILLIAVSALMLTGIKSYVAGDSGTMGLTANSVAQLLTGEGAGTTSGGGGSGSDSGPIISPEDPQDSEKDPGKKPEQSGVNIEDMKKQLELHEGRRDIAYKDTEGIPTIGVGFNLNRADAKAKIEALGLDYQKVKDGKVRLTDKQIDALLEADIKQATMDAKSVFPKFDELSEVRQRVLADMMFNLGKTRFKGFKNMIAAVKKGDFKDAAKEMVDSKWYKQTGNRAKRLVEMMRTGKNHKDIDDVLENESRKTPLTQ